MDGATLKRCRREKGWTQVRLAAGLDVTQAYLSQMETGARPVPDAIARATVRLLGLPATTLPMPESTLMNAPVDDGWVESALAGFRYPGFGARKSRAGRSKINPVEFLIRALAVDDLDPQLAQALPWLLLRFDGCDLERLAIEAKARDLQNRLGFTVALARQVAERNPVYRHRIPELQWFEEILERSRLVAEGSYGRGETTPRGRSRVRRGRSTAATHWNLMTDLKSEDLPYADRRDDGGEKPR